MKSGGKKLKPFDWVTIVLFFLTFVIVAPVWTIKDTIKSKSHHTNQIETMYGEISFSGRVVNFHYIKHPGMPEAAIMCVKLDSCNVNSFYHFDKYTALKIENGIATLPIGTCSKSDRGALFEKVVYVNVNESESHKMIFVNGEKDTIEKSLYYTSSDLKENDMKICDSCH